MDISSISNAYYNIWKLRLEGAMEYQGQVVNDDYLPTSFMEKVTAEKHVISKQFRTVEMTTEVVRAFDKLAIDMRCKFPYIKALTLSDLTTLRFVGAAIKERVQWHERVTAVINDKQVKRNFIDMMNKGLRDVFQ